MRIGALAEPPYSPDQAFPLAATFLNLYSVLHTDLSLLLGRKVTRSGSPLAWLCGGLGTTDLNAASPLASCSSRCA
jgi:hypothetical protein